jgi:hypothetical protein
MALRGLHALSRGSFPATFRAVPWAGRHGLHARHGGEPSVEKNESHAYLRPGSCCVLLIKHATGKFFFENFQDEIS